MTIAYSGDSITFPDNSVQATAPKVGMVNRVINGGMTIDQRNAGASVTVNTNANTFAADRWFGYGQATDGVFTLQQSSTAPAGFTNSLALTVTTADSSIGSTQIYVVAQNIEGLNLSDLGWGTADAQAVTLSFKVRSSLTGTFGGSIRNSDGNRSYPFAYTISSANTWETKTITVSGDTSGTWLTTNGIGMRVTFGVGVGSTYLGTAGSWAGANYISATGATNIIATSGATFYITGVSLEKGSTATSFDYRPYGTELGLCQRYYIQDAAAGVDAYVVLGANAIGTYYFPVYMRASPTITQNGAVVISDGTAATTFSTNPAPYSGPNKQLFSVTANATGRGYLYRPVQFSAEL